MNFFAINWLAVVVCVVVGMASGALWYNPKTFFPAWWQGIGKKDAPSGAGQNMGMVWGLTILSVVVQAVAMAFMVPAMGSLMKSGVTVVSGAQTGFMLWLGFVASTNLVNKLFAGYPLKVWAIEAGNHLLNFLLFGAILGAWH